jgi:hypothetical protein
MLARGSTIYFGNLKQYAVSGDDAKLQQQIAAEQNAHTQPGRTQGGIDMQEKSSSGSMALKFPLKVTNVTQDINSGSGRTARVQGTNVRLAHGAKGSANSIESSVAPAQRTAASPSATPSAAPRNTRGGGQVPGTPASPKGSNGRQASAAKPGSSGSSDLAYGVLPKGDPLSTYYRTFGGAA